MEISTLPSAKRVIHIATSHRADDVRIFERECRSLASSGLFEVTIAGHGTLPDDSSVDLIQFGAIPTSKLKRLIVGMWRAWHTMRTTDAHLWHFHDPETLPVVLLFARLGRTVVWDAHEDYVARIENAMRGNWLTDWLHRLHGRIIRGLIGTVDRYVSGVIAATPTIATRYKNERTAVVGNEARLETFAQCRPRFESRQILFTGAPSAGHLFLEVVVAVKNIPGTHLAVAGREPNSDDWNLANDILGDQLVHVGWLDRAGLANAIDASVLGMVTYQDVSVEDVSAPTKRCEFAAGGLPIVATPNRTNLEVIEEFQIGFLSTDFSSDGLRRAITAALQDEESWRNASSAARRWADEHGNWKTSETVLLNLYRSVLAQGDCS